MSSITVTANPDSLPPRFEIQIDMGGSTIEAVTLSRTVYGITANTRVQPGTGSAYEYVEDYDEPWDTNVVYAATVTTGSGTVTLTASAAQLSSAAAWAIHPLTPALSVCIDQQDSDQIGVIGIDTASRTAQSTQHQILGAARPITTRVGPRSSVRGVLRIATVTALDEDRLWALVDDQTPLLIQFPSGWGVNWEFGYYDIGDVSADRVLQWSGDPRRTFTLPFTVVDPPAVTQQSQWGYAQLLHDFADYPSVAASFVDYPSLLSNSRS